MSHQVDYADAIGIGDDFFTDNSNKTGIGALVNVFEEADPGDLLGGFYASDGFDGGTAGCTPFVSGITGPLDVVVYASAYVRGNFATVFDDPDSLDIHAEGFLVDPDDWADGATVPITTTIQPHWNILAAAEWALAQVDLDYGFYQIPFYTYGCYVLDPDTDERRGNCAKSDGVYIDADPPDTGNYSFRRKYIIAHEAGHYVHQIANGAAGAATDYSAPLVRCFNDWEDETKDPYAEPMAADPHLASEGDHGNHEMNTREYQSAAVGEGFAHYFAALAFNEIGQDCWFEYYNPLNPDWQLDRVLTDGRTLDCAGSATAPLAYLENMRYGPVEDRGTELDWLRFFWSLGQQPGVDHSLLLSIWDAAEPDGWAPADGAPADRPYTRLRNAAAGAGIGSVWDSLAAYHGVDH
ncbi:hypothetical protein L6R50_05200 [Myxococcota bacterium]|nr:hypothetical protein [Myxococcota bacterium]